MIDILVDSAQTANSVRIVVARVFGVPTDSVAVVDDIANLPNASDYRVVCERRLLGGEFPLYLTIHLNDQLLAPKDGELEIARSIAIQLSARCLISDSDPNPYTMILVGGQTTGPVNLDISKLDERGEFWLA